MATIKCFLPLFLLLSVTLSTMTAQNNGQVWIIVNNVKEPVKADYEKWMTDIFFAPMKTTQDPILKQQFNASSMDEVFFELARGAKRSDN